jgi:glycosyltransferase involved in cell wall biosynthesis
VLIGGIRGKKKSTFETESLPVSDSSPVLMKKILLLADINSPHIQKWAGALSGYFHVGVFSIGKSYTQWHQGLANFELFDEHGFKTDIFYRRTFEKISMLRLYPSLKKAIRKFKPDLIHAHYATSYGFLGLLTGFHPFWISVWGSDVYDFPEEGFVQKKILMANLKNADRIFSTSRTMALQTKKFTGKEVECVPFGIDTSVFKPVPQTKKAEGNPLVLGMVKTMQDKYGVEYLIGAFKILREKLPGRPMQLLLVGGGPQREFLEQLSNRLGLGADVLFTGEIPFSKVVEYHNRLDIAVYPSTLDSESFGVSVLESCACEKPVIVSDVAGLKEVVIENKTGLVVPRKNSEAVAEAILKLIGDENLRMSLGANARAHVQKEYEWDHCLRLMIENYNSLLK